MQLARGKNGRTLDKPHKNGKGDVISLGADARVYRPSDKEPFMNERQRDYFRLKLLDWREDILKEAKETLQHLQDESQNHPDLADRASSETDRAIELRARDRQRKLIAKILHCSASRRALTVIARKPASRSRSSAWKRGQLRRCRLKPRSATNGASASTATIKRENYGCRRLWRLASALPSRR